MGRSYISTTSHKIMSKFSFIVVEFFLFLHCSNGLGTIKRISVRPSECEDCGMTAFGQVNMKICGGVPEACCAVVNIANFEQLYEGVIYDFTGDKGLEDCFEYSLQRVNTLDQFGMTVYHEGSDGGQFDWVEIETSDSSVIKCSLGQFMDDFDSVDVVPTRDCTINGAPFQ